MNAKKNKLAETKAKLMKYAPQIAFVGAVAGVFAAGYFSSKNSPVIDNIEDIDEEVLPGHYEVIAAITRDDLTKLSQSDSYEVTNIDADLFRIKEIKSED
ncbi:hypothetical protein SEA_BING_34 [Streptomyces phage Bing]|uniref:Uncharacterized protein n=1 Tax=Streptomyces phage Bing TaxID=2079427 RepID=A0A2L1IWB4_9CAUD|nr:hypothetical protein FDJ31_gp34 [Streptomyces phage Bing]AVD99456.1 hypothetical protein SEA_BING_34 [Streptomyces phage Bing]